jgi:hypothetical protein
MSAPEEAPPRTSQGSHERKGSVSAPGLASDEDAAVLGTLFLSIATYMCPG